MANSLRNHVRGIADDLEKNNGWNQLAPPSIIEWATRPDSEIGKQGAAAGVTVFRLTQETGDLTKNIGVPIVPKDSQRMQSFSQQRPR